VLGWRRTRDETLALAEELLEEGRVLSAVADELGISDRYLRRLLK
jgi:AraC-like DNA-binding protein